TPAQAIVNQDVAGEESKQQYALENACNRAWHTQTALRQLAPDIEQSHDKAGKDDAQRMKSADERDDDRRKPVAGGNGGRKLTDGSHDFSCTGQTGKASGHQQRYP